jgi:glutamine amidotransferase-like uncharacterized protein
MNTSRWRQRPFTLLAVLGFVAAACIVFCRSNNQADILLFNGPGTSRGDVAALEAILHRHQFNYVTVDSWWLNTISESQLRAHRLLIVPGGNFVRMGNGLEPATAAKVRNAVRTGLNYLGICAGAFIAGNSPFNGLNLTGGVAFPFYSAEARGIHKTAVWVQTAGELTLHQYWEDGPALIGWGDVVGKYPEGTPAIVEANVGEGLVILSGVHPEAPESWRSGMNFMTPARLDNHYAAELIYAARLGTPLAHF